MQELTVERTIAAPIEVVWQVVSDVVGYAEAAPNLSEARVLAGQGVGMVRQCWDTRGGTWKEQCVLWEEGRAYSFRVDTSDYPHPLDHMQGTWSVQPHTDGTTIHMRFEYQPKYGIVGSALAQLMAPKTAMKRLCEQILDHWETRIEALTAQLQTKDSR
jgi:ribosome-associated toxin RatA of RatAB toxin-antitoxin module